MRRLDRDLERPVAELLEELDLLEGGRDERVGLVLLSEVEKMLRQRARVRADPHRNPRPLGRADHLLDLLRAADVSRIDADGGDTGVDRLERQRGVEVDVGDDGDRREAHDQRQCLRVLRLRDGDPNELAAGGGESGDLRGGRLDVVRLRERHRLHSHGRTAADRHAPDVDLNLARHCGQCKEVATRGR